MAGDTLKVAVKVKEKHPPKESRGRVVLELNVTNQKRRGYYAGRRKLSRKTEKLRAESLVEF